MTRKGNNLSAQGRVFCFIMDLFENTHHSNEQLYSPLAVRMRPKSLNDFYGQEHIIQNEKLLKKLISNNAVGSIILYGPPGTGKTTIAHIISQTTGHIFKQVNAVASNVSELRSLIEIAQKTMRLNGQRTILFVDEIHRFNKAQQDVLLPYIENNTIGFIGATTQNPCLALTSPLLSRSHIFQFKPLSEDAIAAILRRALNDHVLGLGGRGVAVSEECLKRFACLCDGDARKALNALEVVLNTSGEKHGGSIAVELSDIDQAFQKKWITYDRDGDNHYDTVSAFIKSMRGSDPDAAVYWLAKMIEAGEDPRFIARRIVICASEDVGNADPLALSVAVSAFQALEFIGMPEAQLALAQAAIYIATAPKSNAVTVAIGKACKEVKQNRVRPVPSHLRDAHYAGASSLGIGRGYKYPHDFQGHYVRQDYGVAGITFYSPSNQGFEKVINRRLAQWKK